MLTDLMNRLHTLLEAASCPVYLADSVPPDAAFPYMTMQVEPAVHPGCGSPLTLTAWHCSGTSNTDRFALADTLLTLIPASGLRIPLESGVACLYRARGKGVSCVRSTNALGLTMPMMLYLCP